MVHVAACGRATAAIAVEGVLCVIPEFVISRDGFLIRPAAAADAKALRMLLPEMRDGAVRFVVVDGRDKLVIGAAAVTHSHRLQPLVGPGVSIRVIEPCRRQGVGRALFEQLEHVAKSAGAKALFAVKRVDLDSDEMRAWEWFGFRPCETVEEHVMPSSQFEPQLGPLVVRMRERGRIPVSARVVPLYQADLAAVLQLHLGHMGGDREELYRKLRGRGPGAFHSRYSHVLLIDNKVKGCMLAHRSSHDTMTVDANVIDPELRGGWANALLKLEAFRGAFEELKWIRFTTFDHYTDTRSFTGKLGGSTVRTTLLMIRPLD
jgi:N-acetylglutamate synthase-like GNAT family acetyltransferase